MPMTPFTQDCVDRMTTIIGEVSARPMFGGYGLYRNDKIFGCVMRDQLFLKADDVNRDTFLAGGSTPMTNHLVQSPTTRKVSMPYYSADVDDAHFAEWVQLAADAAERAPAKPAKKLAPSKT